MWNRLGTRLLPKLRTGDHLRIGVEISLCVKGTATEALVAELRQSLADLGLSDRVEIEIS